MYFMEKKKVIILSVTIIAALFLIFVAYKVIEGTKGTCACPMYSMPAPCQQGEEPVMHKPAKLHWYCKEACGSPPSCSPV